MKKIILICILTTLTACGQKKETAKAVVEKPITKENLETITRCAPK